jgi:hypothetical protein
VLVPGEAAAPATSTGKTGAPDDQTVGQAFSVRVNAVDHYFNRVYTAPVNIISISSTNTGFAPPAKKRLSSGRAVFSVRFRSGGSNQKLVAHNVSNSGITAGTSTGIRVSTVTPHLDAGAIAKAVASIRAYAQLSRAYRPTGTITFSLYGPGDTSCSGTPVFTDTATVTHNGRYRSSTYAPTQAGAYRFTSAYSGDGANASASTPCASAGSGGTTFSVCVVPKVKHKTLAEARRLIVAAHCSVGHVKHRYSRIKKGHVVWQRWAKPGTRRPGGTPIYLWVSKGKKPHHKHHRH